VTYLPTQDAGAAVAGAAGASLVVMVVAVDSSEGSDRISLFLPPWQDAMVAALAAAGAPLVVVARCPGACHMPWAPAVGSILYELLPGQESGNSIANTLFGDNVPSGRLPVSFPAPPASGSGLPTDTWLSPPGGGPVNPEQYPGTDRGRGFPEADYSEGLFVGYRWYDARGTKPEWAFGHGLSYATFNYTALAVVGGVSPTASATIYATVCNVGGPAASEVAQLYLGYPAAANEPPKLLKGFQKVAVSAGGCEGVGFSVSAKDLWVWDVVAQAWALVPGTYTVLVGASSADIRLTGALTVTAQ
jgi:beta-glucosidase